MINSARLNDRVIDNLKNVKLWFFIPPLSLLVLGVFYFAYLSEGSYIDTYTSIQKDLFFTLNGFLSQFPKLELNLTQLGDVLVFFPLISIFIIYAPKVWENVLTASLIAGLFSAVLKKLFAIPRPAAMFDNDSFTIIGRKLVGAHSFPSGHSIASFVIITILLYAFMPKKNRYKVLWSILVLLVGFIIAFSRVGVGAHYPLDVIGGSIIGYVVTIFTIRTNNKTNWLKSIHHKKYQLVTMLIILIWIGIIIQKLMTANLPIFYIALLALFITFYLILKSYVQKRNKTNTSSSNN